MRYRRSTLGPFWATLSMGIQILITGFVMSYLFHTTVDRFLPFVAIGLIMWNTLTGIVSDAALAFISAADLILQVKRPLSVYLFQVVWRNMIIAGHSIVIFFIVAFVFGLFPGPTYILVIPGIALFFLNAVWMAGIAAILSTRFRDIPMIVTSVFMALFWLTPVVYELHQLGGGGMGRLIVFNPLYHILEVLRAPLLLSAPTAVNWAVAAGSAIVGWLLLIMLFARARARIPYWL
jgi:lipopolysaccharide transport system permease protein